MKKSYLWSLAMAIVTVTNGPASANDDEMDEGIKEDLSSVKADWIENVADKITSTEIVSPPEISQPVNLADLKTSVKNLNRNEFAKLMKRFTPYEDAKIQLMGQMIRQAADHRDVALFSMATALFNETAGVKNAGPELTALYENFFTLYAVPLAGVDNFYNRMVEDGPLSRHAYFQDDLDVNKRFVLSRYTGQNYY